MILLSPSFSFFFFNDTATTEIYTLSLHDALPISIRNAVDRAETRAKEGAARRDLCVGPVVHEHQLGVHASVIARSEEHTSELQSQSNLVCRLLLEKKKKIKHHNTSVAYDRMCTPL